MQSAEAAKARILRALLPLFLITTSIFQHQSQQAKMLSRVSPFSRQGIAPLLRSFSTFSRPVYDRYHAEPVSPTPHKQHTVPLLLTHLKEAIFLISKPPTFQDTINEAKAVFHFTEDTPVLLVSKSDGIEMALTESFWDYASEKVEGKRMRLEVKVVEEKSELGKRMKLKALEKEQREDTEAIEATNAAPASTQLLESEVDNIVQASSNAVTKTEATVNPRTITDATSFDDLTSLRVAVHSPCFRCSIALECNPHTMTLGYINEMFFKKYASHDPLKCRAEGTYCTDKVEVDFGYMKPGTLEETLLIDWLRKRNELYHSDYQPKYLNVEGLSIYTSYRSTGVRDYPDSSVVQLCIHSI